MVLRLARVRRPEHLGHEDEVATGPEHSSPSSRMSRTQGPGQEPVTVPSLRRRLSLEAAVAWGVVGAAMLFVLWQLHPSLLFRDTTPATGDLAGHMNAIAHLRDDLLRNGRLAGWSQDWFTGFPSFTFYLPMAGLFVAVFGLVLPLNVALKLVVTVAPLALLGAAYAFGRLNECDRLTSACFTVATLPFLFQPSLFFRGGSIAATVGGEFNYGLSLGTGLLVVGLARAGLRTGRHRALTAGLLAVTLLLHVVPAVMAVLGIAVATVLRSAPARAKVRWSGPTLAVAGTLSAFWLVPFVVRGQFTAGSEAPTAPPLLEMLLPVEIIPVLILAVVGWLVTSTTDSENRGHLRYFLLAMAAVTALACVVTPTTRLGVGRFVGVFLLWLCLFAGYGLAGLARAVDTFRRKLARGRPFDAPARARLLMPVVALGAILPLYDSRDWNGLLTATTQPFLSKTAGTQFRGYERSLDRVEFDDFYDTVRSVGVERGCGRAHLEIADGTWSTLSGRPLSWLTPLVTDGCITLTGGLYVQSSPTSPFVDAVNARLSSASAARPKTPSFDLDAGLAGLRTLGVRYFIATNPETVQAADASSDLRPVAETATYGGERFWKVYELPGVEVVEPLRHLPVVVPGVGRSRTSWEETAKEWFDEAIAREVVVAADGPAAWPRDDDVARLPQRPTEETTVSRVRIDQDRVSFRVSRTGVPVLVKVSYFPNWKISGADGPWRVTPNQMVVVPTSTTVTLRYGSTPVEYAGWLGTLVGVGGLVVLARRGPVDMPAPMTPTPTERPRPTPRSQAASKRKKRRR